MVTMLASHLIRCIRLQAKESIFCGLPTLGNAYWVKVDLYLRGARQQRVTQNHATFEVQPLDAVIKAPGLPP